MNNRVTLSYIQFNPEFGNVDKNLIIVSKLLSKVKPGIIVLPELMNTGYNFKSKREVHDLSESFKTGKTSLLLSKISSDINSTIVAGFVEKSKNNYYNSAMIVSKGKFIGVYRKTHLFYNGNSATFDNDSTPNSRLYNNTSSGISVTSISAAGDNMTLTISK